MMYKVIGYCWLTAQRNFGIVITEGAIKDKRAYIGNTLGIAETPDLRMICEIGQRIKLEIAEEIIKEHGTIRTIEI